MAAQIKYAALVRVIHHRHFLFLIAFLLTLCCHIAIGPKFFNLRLLPDVRFNLQAFLLLFACVPGRIPGWCSIVCALLPLRMHQLSRKEPKRSFSRLVLCYVTKGQNKEAMQRSIESLPNLHHLDHRLELHIVTEENALANLQHLATTAKIHGVPTEFKPVRAKYKAKALEWFRRTQNFSDKDWILHLDEETRLDVNAISSVINAIERDPAMHIAQGVILYNAHHYWENTIIAYADVKRVLDDFGRYQFQWNYCRRPIFGMHGSFVLINGKVENEVTWETDNVTEDYWFALQAQNRGYKFGWIPAFAREQSPQSLWDFVQQRRRWAMGIWNVGDTFASMLVLLWAWQALELFTWVILLLRLDFPLPTWLWQALCVENSISMASMSLALAFQDFDANMSIGMMCLHIAFAPFVLPWTSFLESFAVLSALVWPTKHSFHIVKK